MKIKIAKQDLKERVANPNKYAILMLAIDTGSYAPSRRRIFIAKDEAIETIKEKFGQGLTTVAIL